MQGRPITAARGPRETPVGNSPFSADAGRRLDPRKFRDPMVTLDGAPRAFVHLKALSVLWFNTGTLCNIACQTCYIDSSPRNDALVYLTAAEVAGYLAEIEQLGLPTGEIGFTGGEPFMNGEIVAMLAAALASGRRVLVLTNAMRPMRRFETALIRLRQEFGHALTLRVSLDHHTRRVHEAERGAGTWRPALDGLSWLASHGFRLAVAGRRLAGEADGAARRGYRRLFAEIGLDLDAADPARLVLFPQLDANADVPEVTQACWSALGVPADSVMCAGSRMVVKRKGAARPVVVACTLIPYDRAFELGERLLDAAGTVRLNHPHCAKFCLLGGASCSG
ncbi:MAG: radical SAM protein [Caulobacteraceae bacterium]